MDKSTRELVQDIAIALAVAAAVILVTLFFNPDAGFIYRFF